MTIDAKILRALRNASDDSVSGASLAEELGISRAAVWARIEDLRKLGYKIEANPHEGYRLLTTPDLLHADDLMALLGPDRTIGRDIRVFQETTSTNDIADKLGRDGVPEGAVIFAESQSKGRGRLGRNWVSPKGKGLWFSVLLRPPLPPQLATQITIASATALRRALSSLPGVEAEIKWPNDILIRGKKVCGILTEMSAEVDKIKHIVLGVGVDVNFEGDDFPPDVRKIATSLRIETNAAVHRAKLAATILHELDSDYRKILKGGFPTIAEEWEHHCTTLGRRVEIAGPQRVIQGQAEALDAEGALLVRTEHGRLERIIGGDVTIRK